MQSHEILPATLLCPQDSPGKNTEMGSHSLLQGIFPTQGPNSGLLRCRQILYRLSHQRSLERCRNGACYSPVGAESKT